MDIGGGSTQLICRDFVKSYPIGAVRAKDFFQNGIPLRRVLDEIFDELPEPGAEFAGAGGTITTLAALDMGLARYDACLVQRHRLTFNRLRQLTAELDAMGEAGRRALPLF